MSTHKGVFSDNRGNFAIVASPGDRILFTHVGYKNKVIIFQLEDQQGSKEIKMSLKPVQLKDVTIRKGPTQYQLDSARRADIYKDAFEYEQQKSVMTPITSVYQKFSKKYKRLRKFQDQIVDIEQQKFIDTRYNPEIVMSLTKVNEETCNEFMKKYPMDLDYARTASDLEIKMWIKYNYQDFLKANPDEKGSMKKQQ